MTLRLFFWALLVAAVAAVGYAGRASGGKPPKDALYLWTTAANEALVFVVILLLVLLIALGLPKRRAFALRAPVSWRLAGGIAAACLVGIYLLNLALDPLLHPGREQGLTPNGWDGNRAAPFAANAVVFILFGPLVEELTFRGLGFSLLQRFGRPVAIAVVGLAFGLWHGLVDALPLLAAFGAALAYLRSRTESVYPGIVLHAAFNGIAIAGAVLTG